MGKVLDLMEYANDAVAQAAYVTDGILYPSQYPTQDDAHVKATTTEATYNAYLTTDPTKLLTGPTNWNQWVASSWSITNQRFHIDLGSAKIVKRIYYENGHHNGGGTDRGTKNFTFWGSNDAGDFADLVYVNDGTWTQITPAQSTFDQHVALDQADPKYILVTNTTAYRYYAFKFADNWGSAQWLGPRRIELQTFVPDLQCYSEDTIKQQGSYSLKVVAQQTESLNNTLTRTVSPTLNLSNIDILEIYAYASRTGTNIQIQIHDSGGTTSTKDIVISSAGAWEKTTWDISGISNENKDAIDQIIIKIINDDTINTFYADNFLGLIDKTFAESLSLSEPSVVKATTRMFSDSLALNDTYSRQVAFSRTFTETLTLTEVAQKAIGIFITDAISLADLIIKGVGKTFTESLSLSDVFAKALLWVKKTFSPTSWSDKSHSPSSWSDVSRDETNWQDKY